MKLNTAEKFLILAHHPEKGRFVINGLQLSYGIVGALLLEMSLEKIVSVQDNRLVYSSAGIEKDPVISELSATIRQSEKSRRKRFWISKFARKSRRYKWTILGQLTDKRLIRIENKKFLGLIPYKKSYIIDSSIRTELIRTARNNVLNRKDLNEENVVVLGLIVACNMHRIISSDHQELKKIRKELKEIIKESPIAGVLAETIKQVRTAIIASVAASSAASSSAASG
jgi:golgi phosphoprotein 3